MKSYRKIVRRTDHALLWAHDVKGPHGGKYTIYAPRKAEQTEPSAWVSWSGYQKDVSVGDVIGTGNRI